MIEGTWTSGDGTVLNITKSNDSNGTLEGTITANANGQNLTLNITGNYRYTENSGPGVTISFTGGRGDNPNLREAWAGSTVQDGAAPSHWELWGGRGIAGSSTSSGEALHGIFK